MKKVLFLLLVTSFLLPNYIFAGNNLVFTCTDSSCEKSSNLPLFSESNIYPSYSVSQTTTIINHRTTNCNLNFKLSRNQETDLLSSVISVSSVGETTVWYSGTLESLFDNVTHTLGHIPANTTREIVWTAVFNQNAGNEYQGVTNLFDIDFNFTCDDPPSNQTDNPVNNNNPPECNDSFPNFIPQNFYATSGLNSVTLNWTKPSGNFTYYLIAFGDNQNADKYGNPNIGGPDTTTYTVNNLSSGTTYYFKIRTGNGCAPGPFSAIVSTTPGGQILINPIIPSGFQPGVLGTETTTPSVTDLPLILGEQTSNSTCHWVFKYLFVLIVLVNILFRKIKPLAFLLSLITFFVDYFVIDTSCRWWFWWIIDIFSFALPFLILK